MMDIVNFVHGTLFVVGVYSVWLAPETAGINPLLGIPVTAAVLLTLGVVVHIPTVKPIIRAPQQNQFTATLDVLFATQSAIEVIFTSDLQ